MHYLQHPQQYDLYLPFLLWELQYSSLQLQPLRGLINQPWWRYYKHRGREGCHQIFHKRMMTTKVPDGHSCHAHQLFFQVSPPVFAATYKQTEDYLLPLGHPIFWCLLIGQVLQERHPLHKYLPSAFHSIHVYQH